MKKQLLSLILLFGALSVLSVVFPYESACKKDVPKEIVTDPKKNLNLANYTALKSDQVARTESGEVYHLDANRTPYNDAFVEDNYLSETNPCLNCKVDFKRIEFLNELERAAFNPMDEVDFEEYKPPSSFSKKEWTEQGKQQSRPRSDP